MKISFLVLTIIVFSKEIQQFDNNHQSSIHDYIQKNQCQILQNFNHIEESVTLQYFTRSTIFKKQEQECKSEYDYRNYQIQDANFILKKSKLIYQQCYKKYSVSQIKGQILNQQKVNNEVFINILFSISQQENELYNNKFRQFQVALQLIHVLKRQINQINDTKQLITQVVNFMQGILLSKITRSADNEFNNLFWSLVEFGEQIDFDCTFEKSKLLNILNKLLSCTAAIKENLNKLTNQIQGIVKQNQIKK